MNHEVLWAPWRLAYVESGETPTIECENLLEGADKNCFICRAAVAQEPRRALVLERGAHVLTLLNRYPYNNGHLLVAPQRHIASPSDCSREEAMECWQRMAAWPRIIERAFKAQGFNIGLNLGAVAGAGVPGHLHWHIVPRWNGDINFMTTLAGTRVIPQALEAACDQLSKAWSAEHGI